MANNKTSSTNKKRSKPPVRVLTAETSFSAEEVRMAPSSATRNGAPTLSIPTISETLREQFREDDKVRAVFTRHLAERTQDSQEIATRARNAFVTFKPSMFTSGQRDKGNYLVSGKHLTQSMNAVIEKGVAEMREATGQHTTKFHVGDELQSLITRGRIPLPDLIKFFRDKLGDVPTLQNDPTRTACDAEAKANKVLDKIDGKKNAADSDEPAQPSVATPKPADDDAAGVKEFVTGHVDNLLEKVTPPEGSLEFNVKSRAKLKDTENSVSTFQLREGASDVTSYHDFNVLQMAFEHVWTEIFDSRLKSLGTQLYHEAAQLEKFSKPNGTTNLKGTITSIPDLVDLLRSIGELSGTTAYGLPDFTTYGEASNAPGQVGKVTGQVVDIPGARRLAQLLNEIDRILRQPYAFTVFAKNSYNFGFMVTYRQTWRPEQYQVGDLVSTIPLAPREIRRYTTRHVVKKTRAVKEVEDSLRNTRSETSGTSRVEREILDKAQQKTNFDVTTHGSFGGEGYETDVTAKAGGEQAKQSEKAKKHFHEAVLKSAQEYRQQHRMEIDTTTSEETEGTTFHEIQNPNDELTVTYMFYELQRTYRISEKIHQLTPVILVANEMPAPDAIDDAWLIRHDWILRRVILDDSFKPALEYLTKSFVGAELNIRILDNNAKAQKQVVDRINEQIETQKGRLEGDERRLADTVKSYADNQQAAGVVNTVKRIFDPLGITGKEGEGAIAAHETMTDYLQETFDRAEREKARLLEQLGVATTALQAAIDKLSAATKEHYDRISEVERVRIHVKENILYYMQAIWRHEPQDQRFFRVYNIDVSIVEPETSGVQVTVKPIPPNILDELRNQNPNSGTMGVTAELPIPPVKITPRKLVEIADLDTVLGYKGNYAIYALKENNYITLHMMQDYLEVSDDVKLRDPDDFSNDTVDDLQQLAACMRQKDRQGFDKKYRDEFKKLIIKRLMSGRAEDDRVIVPTTSLYVEALVGTHPLLEDFKLVHRALDVKKVQAEVRRAELENIRLAARALEGEREDPDIEKKIVVQGLEAGVTLQPDNG